MASRMATPRYCIQNSRFTKQDGWRLWSLSLSLNGNIAVTGCNVNTGRTYIDVYTNVRHDWRHHKPKLFYTKEFEKYESEDMERRVSFYPRSDTTILSGLGDKLEVIDLIQDRVIKFRKIKLVNHGRISCLSVRETEIFIGFVESNKVTIYDVMNLKETKSIILQGIRSGDYPCDIIPAAGKLFCCIGRYSEDAIDKALIFEEKSGRILSELARPTDMHRHAENITVTLGVTIGAVVLWAFGDQGQEPILEKRCHIVFSSLLSENSCSFLIVEVTFGVTRIRISDRGDRMITGNLWTGEVKVYDMAEVFTYNLFKETLASTLQTDECTKLTNLFNIPRDQADGILSSEIPSKKLLFSLAEKGILQPHNVDRLIEAFDELEINPICRHVAEFFRETRTPSYYKEVIKKLEEEMKTLRMRPEEEGKECKAPWTKHKAPDGRVYYHNPVTKESRWENVETGQIAESHNKSEELYVNTSSKASEFLEKTSLEGEFAKFSVKVSEKLTKANCVKLATYFNFPAAKIDLIKRDVDTPGLKLFDILKERHIVHIHNVMSLKEALEELELKDISETLVTPYQRNIDRMRFEQQYLST